jgi:SAM-dependent methyltransferase
MAVAEYEKQDRGGDIAYDRYLRGMDASMRQKVALTAAHLLCEGELADMGMGSGSGSYALAALYPELSVIGVDIDPEMVRRAAERYSLPNLRFIEGDIAEPCFGPGSMEAILDSSVLHHVTSYGGYERAAAARAMEAQVAQLAVDGVLIVRDFIDPGDGTVWLDVRNDDGDDSDDPETCSTARLLERFAREFRFLSTAPGFELTRREGSARCPLPPHMSRYELTHSVAVELILRKDYRKSWSVEVQEEYLYATASELEAVCARLGLRVLASTPIHNPWIVRNRFDGQVRLFRPGSNEQLDHPATNYLLVGQKVAPGEGVTIQEGERCAPVNYLERTHYRHVERGEIYDLASRPGVTTDLLPWFQRDGRCYVLARRGYPRPLLRGATKYVTEPLITTGDPAALLASFPGVQPVAEMEPGTSYFPSPGGIEERVRSMLVEVAPINVQHRIDNVSGFSTSGVLRAIEARQLLRAAQVGGMPDARLELNTYELLLRRGVDVGAWIGDAIDVSDGPPPRPSSLEALLSRPPRRLFTRCSKAAGFLEVHCASFIERDAAGHQVRSQIREWVEPARFGVHTVAVAVLLAHAGDIYFGLDDHDLPAAQRFDGNSAILVTPAWRIPRQHTSMRSRRRWVLEQLHTTYGLWITSCFTLGGHYHPSAGLTPETVHPIAVVVHAPTSSPLHWVKLSEVIDKRQQVVDGHTRIVALRAAHALSLL